MMNRRRENEICMKNVKTRLKYDFGVGDLLLTKPASLPKDNSRIS